MPHKVNPIRFENAEANLEVSNALFDVLGSTLVTSRLQRDLTDSSMQRNIGTAFGHSLLALDNVRAAWPVSTPCRRRWPPTSTPTGRSSARRSSRRCGRSAQGVPGMDNPYERLKDLTRGRRIPVTTCASSSPGWACPTTSPSGCPR